MVRWQYTQDELDVMNRGKPPAEWTVNRAMCPAVAKSTGNPCSNPAGAGTSHPGYGVCKFHGGNTPMAKKNAALLMGTEIKEGWKMKFGGDRTLVNLTPEQALLEEVQRSAAFVRFLEEHIGLWDIEAVPPEQGAMPGYKSRNPSTSMITLEPMQRRQRKVAVDPQTGLPMLVDETSKGTPSPTEVDAWLRLYREERAHLAKTAKMAIDGGIAERQVKLAEDQGRLFASGLKLVLAALQLNAEQQALIPNLVPHVIRQMVSGEQPSLPATPSPATTATHTIYADDLIDEEGMQVRREH